MVRHTRALKLLLVLLAVGYCAAGTKEGEAEAAGSAQGEYTIGGTIIQKDGKFHSSGVSEGNWYGNVHGSSIIRSKDQNGERGVAATGSASAGSGPNVPNQAKVALEKLKQFASNARSDYAKKNDPNLFQSGFKDME